MRAVQPAWAGTVDRAGATLNFEVYGERWRHHRVVADLGGGRFPHLEDANWLPVPPLPGRGVRRGRDRALVAPRRADALHPQQSGRRCAGGAGCHRHSLGHPGGLLDGWRAGACVWPPTTPTEFSVWSPSHRATRGAVEPDRGTAPAPYDSVSNPVPDGWAKFNPEYWRHGYADFVEFFMTEVNSDPHSSKGVEDAIRLGPGTDPGGLVVHARRAQRLRSR